MPACQNQAGKSDSSSERDKNVRGERKSICGMEVINSAISLADPGLNVSAGFLSG